MANREEKINALIAHWTEEDARIERIKESQDLFFVKLADFVEKNYTVYMKDPAKYTKLFIAQWVKANEGLYKEAGKSGVEFMGKVL